MTRWLLRAPVLVAGWYLMMAYPLDDSAFQVFASLAVGTLGAVVVGVTCYRAGRDEG